MTLRKVDPNQVRDRSAAMVPGGDTGPAGSGLPPAGATGGGDGGLAGALAAALNKRKQKVSASESLVSNPKSNMRLINLADDEADDEEW